MSTDADGNTRKLPSGLVTFVFTDIEGSTRLYKALGEDIAVGVFDRHNAILRQAWDAHNGYEVHTEGDSFFVVFEDPNDAVAACVAVQQSLDRADWPADGEVRVRIGIHCGLAAPRHDDYMALAVHQAARVMSAASGQQILITDAIVQRLDRVPGYSIDRTGTFRLRDFDNPPALHRVIPQGIISNEHPPRATPASHHNLVPRLTSFIGRAVDVVAVNGLLEPGTAVTLVGLGGIGKTRLATEVGLEVAPTWRDGVWMVELAEVADPELIAEEVASTIGVDQTSVGDRWHDVLEYVNGKSMLLIFDNLEHVIDECARLIPELLRTCPNSTVLSTSREPLNCQGEVTYRVQPLDLSLDDARDAADPTELPSVELFIDRARAVSVDFAWTPQALATVLEICRHLDGLPLAIEIAAAQVGVLQLAEIRSGLDNRFRLLRSRDRALPARQRTMEGLLGWSYQLLYEAEQRAFRRLAVFAGSFSIDAAEAALAGDGIHADDVPELIWSLVDKSLITADLSDSATRYRLLESVQQYALRMLAENEDPDRAALELATWLLGEVAPWKPHDRTWLGDVALELANIRNVVELIGQTGPEVAQQLMCSVGRYRDTMQSYHAGVDELQWAAETLRDETPSRVVLLAELAYLHLRMGNVADAQRQLDEAAQTQLRVGPPEWNDVAVERSRGELAIRTGDYTSAIELATETLERGVSKRGQAHMWSLSGIAQSSLGDLEPGLAALEEALAIYLDLHESAHIAMTRGNVAEAAWRLGLYQRAAQQQRSCLEDALAIGQQQAITYSLIMATRLAVQNQDWRSAALMHAHAEATLRHAGHELYEDEHDAMQESRRQAEQNLDPSELASILQEGSDMSVLQAAQLAFATFAATDPEFAINPFDS